MVTIICPTCGKTLKGETRSDLPYRPFCSQRCKQIDLGRWLTEDFVIREEVSSDQVIESDDESGAASGD